MVPRIRQIQVRNFKSIERAVVDLEPFTVLVGPNGAGKSNFVEALSLLRECVVEGLAKALRHPSAAVLPRWSQGPSENLGLHVRLDLPGGTRADYALEIQCSMVKRPIVARERCVVSGGGKPEASFEVVEGEFVQGIAGISPRIESDRLALFAASTIGAFRPVYDFIAAIRRYSINPQQVATGSARGADPGQVLSRDGDNALFVLKAMEEESPAARSRVASLLGRAVKGVVAVRAREVGDGLALEVTQDLGLDRSHWFAGSEVSDGTLRLLGILLAVYQPDGPSVMAIEEPESTVHPAATQVITQVLLDAAQERQVLITTHSPDVLDSKDLSDDQIRVVTQRHGRTIIAPLSHASRQAIRERLYTPGELLRLDELDQDIAAAEAAAQDLDLFPSQPVPS